MAETDEMREEARHYIFDCMANNAYQKEDWKKAEKLFIDVLARQLSKVVDQSDDSMVEISVKLASIYSINGDFEKAQHGFKFCMNAIKKRVEHLVEKPVNELDDNEKNSLILWAMILDKRAKHLSSYGNHKGAVDDYLQSLRLCERINGSTHPQTLILMNDLATTYVHMNDVENAVTYLKKAISGGIKTESEDLATFYFNLGTIYLRQNDANQAEVVCRESFSLATKAEDYPLIGKSKECLQKARKAQ